MLRSMPLTGALYVPTTRSADDDVIVTVPGAPVAKPRNVEVVPSPRVRSRAHSPGRRFPAVFRSIRD